MKIDKENLILIIEQEIDNALQQEGFLDWLKKSTDKREEENGFAALEKDISRRDFLKKAAAGAAGAATAGGVGKFLGDIHGMKAGEKASEKSQEPIRKFKKRNAMPVGPIDKEGRIPIATWEQVPAGSFGESEPYIWVPPENLPKNYILPTTQKTVKQMEKEYMALSYDELLDVVWGSKTNWNYKVGEGRETFDTYPGAHIELTSDLDNAPWFQWELAGQKMLPPSFSIAVGTLRKKRFKEMADKETDFSVVNPENFRKLSPKNKKLVVKKLNDLGVEFLAYEDAKEFIQDYNDFRQKLLDNPN